MSSFRNSRGSLARPTIWSIFLPLLFLTTACSNENLLQMIRLFEKTTLVVELEPGVGQKAIYPDADLDVAYFDISGAGPDGATFSETGYASSLFSQAGLAAGEWTISAVAKNAAGTVVGSSPPLTVNLENATQTHARLVCQAPEGNGFYSISISWPAGVISYGYANPVAAMVSQTGQRHQVVFDHPLNIYSKAGTVGLPELPAGSYRLESRVSDGMFSASTLWRKEEDIYIGEGVTTRIEYTLSMEDLELQPGVRTFAGRTTQTSYDGLGTQATFNYPSAIAIHSDGTMYVADTGGNRIRKINPEGQVSTLAGGGVAGFQDGLGTNATFNAPEGIAIRSDGTILVADTGNNLIRSVTSWGNVSTLAGNRTYGAVDGVGTGASFRHPRGIAEGENGIIYVADTESHTIRKISGTIVSTLAGSPGISGFADNTTGLNVRFWEPSGLAVDVNGDYLYVADTKNNRIRKVVTNSGYVSTLAGGAAPGAVDGLGAGASFRYPHGVTVGEAESVYVADSGNSKLRRITREGAVTTIAGSGAAFWQDGPLLESAFYEPRGLAYGGPGRIFVTDTLNARIRLVLTK